MKRVLAALMFVGYAGPVLAQDQDAMLRWTETKVVHYRVVGEYSATLNIFARSESTVTDRVEIDFDWNQEENKLVGQPAIKNFPTKTGTMMPLLECPAPKVSGAFEFITVLSLKDQPDETVRITNPGLIMESKRDYPAGEVPLLPDSSAASCGSKWEKLPATSVPASEVFPVPLAMLLAMGQFGGSNIAPDRKSFINKFEAGTANAGWTWTYTPTPVK